MSPPETSEDTGDGDVGLRPHLPLLGSIAILAIGMTAFVSYYGRAGFLALDEDGWAALVEARSWAHGLPGPVQGGIPSLWTLCLAFACAVRVPSPAMAVGLAFLMGSAALVLADRAAARDRESRELAVLAVLVGTAMPFAVGGGGADALGALIGVWCADGVRRASDGVAPVDLPLRFGLLGALSPGAAGAAVGLAGWLWRRGSASPVALAPALLALIVQGGALVWLGSGAGCPVWATPSMMGAPALLAGVATTSPPVLIGAVSSLLLAGGSLGWLASWCSVELARRASAPVTLAGIATLAVVRIVEAEVPVDPRDAHVIVDATTPDPLASDVPGSLAWQDPDRAVRRWCEGEFDGMIVTRGPVATDRAPVVIDVDADGQALRAWPAWGTADLQAEVGLGVARMDTDSGAVRVAMDSITTDAGILVRGQWVIFYTNGVARFEAPADGRLVGVVAASIVERPARFSVDVAGVTSSYDADADVRLLDFGAVRAGDPVRIEFADDLVVGEADRNMSVGSIRVLSGP